MKGQVEDKRVQLQQRKRTFLETKRSFSVRKAQTATGKEVGASLLFILEEGNDCPLCLSALLNQEKTKLQAQLMEKATQLVQMRKRVCGRIATVFQFERVTDVKVKIFNLPFLVSGSIEGTPPPIPFPSPPPPPPPRRLRHRHHPLQPFLFFSFLLMIRDTTGPCQLWSGISPSHGEPDCQHGGGNPPLRVIVLWVTLHHPRLAPPPLRGGALNKYERLYPRSPAAELQCGVPLLYPRGGREPWSAAPDLSEHVPLPEFSSPRKVRFFPHSLLVLFSHLLFFCASLAV